MKSALLIFATVLGVAFAFPAEDEPAVPQPRNSCNIQYAFRGAGEQANLTSPNWPNSYPNNANCLYKITSPSGTQIRLDCDVNIEYAQRCTFDKLSISLSGDSTLSDGKGVCGNGRFSQTSSSNSLAIGFKSDQSNPNSNTPFRYTCALTVVGEVQTTMQTPPEAEPGTGAGSFANRTCTCGARNENRIVGGVVAEVNEFPWRVGIYSRGKGVFCGGTIISPNWIVTAAHCIGKAGWTHTQPLQVNVADHDYTTTTESRNQLITVDRIINHAAYNDQTQDNDIALLHLERPLTYDRTIQPICLPWTMTGETFQGKTITASGWGTTSSGGSASTVLRKVDLPVLTTEECSRYYRGMLTPNMFCTYAPGKDTCQGDSGGSIDYLEPNADRYFGIGVVSWGIGCAGENKPGVYAKVTNYLSWIEQNTAGEQFCR